MKFKQLISKALLAGIFISNTGFSSLASTLSGDTRYETFKGDSITINDVLEEDEVDIEIEGNTLVNLADNSQGWTLASNNIIAFNHIDARLLKPNTDYTILFLGDMSEVKSSATTLQNVTENNNNVIGSSTSDKYKYKVRTNSLIHNGASHPIYIIPHIYPHDGEVFSQEYLDNLDLKVMIFEGDLDKLELPREYFKGMKSVGQDNGNKIKVSSEKTLYGVENLYIGKYINTKGELVIDVNQIGSDFIDVIPNNEIISNLPSNTYFKEFDSNRKHIRTLENTTRFTISENTKYITFNFHTTSTINWVLNNYVYIGYKDDLYESMKKEIVLKESLKGLANTVKDRIVKINNNWYVERNYDEIILDGSDDEAWQWSSDVLWRFKTPKKHYACEVSDDGYEYGNGASDKYPQVQAIIGGLDYAFKVQAGYLQFRNKEYADGDIDLWRNYLKYNPIRVIYQLDKPIYEPIEYGPLTLYKNTTHISNDSVIPATMKVTVDRVLNRAIESVELAKTSPTMENLSRARMWINLAEDSILKDQLQNEINNITSIDDLQLERKVATGNLDVYIKSQNMLSISLNTNNITFDGYSGAEDMEMLGAVNISINSSLPYSLNAYMPSEIANSDKSEVLPIDILNIRESNGAVYQRFANTVDKVVLKDNCSNGNDLVHNIDLKLASNLAHKADVYKTVIKFEAEQK